MEKVKKYLFQHITQLGSLSHDITLYPNVIPTDLCTRIEQSGEWHLYLHSVQPSTQQFDILGWWEGMREHLPLLYKCARHTLAINHTACNVPPPPLYKPRPCPSYSGRRDHINLVPRPPHVHPPPVSIPPPGGEPSLGP